MRNTLRAMTVAVLAAAMLLAAVGTAVATDESGGPDLDTFKAEVLAGIQGRVEACEHRLDELTGQNGPRVEQVRALLGEGIGILQQLQADVDETGSAAQIHHLVRAARAEFAAHARVRLFYAHVQGDIARFAARLEQLDQGITRAREMGLDTTGASVEAEKARASLEAAASILAGVDPADTGGGIMTQTRLAHRAAHAAQSHLRAGLRSLAGRFI